MRKLCWTAAALVVSLSTAVAAEPLARLYRGTAAKDAGVTLGGWGSGFARESKEEAFAGAYSVLVASDGYYAGGRLDFVPPVDLSRFAADKLAALSVHVKFKSAGSTEAGSATPVAGLGGGYFQVPMPGMPGPGPRGPGMPGIPGMPGMPGAVPGVGTQDAVAKPATSHMRFVLVGGGATYEASHVPVDTDASENGWYLVQAPLQSFVGSGAKAATFDGFKLDRLLVFGDVVDDFYIGDIEIVRYAAAVTDVDAGEEQTVAINETVSFKGAANGPPGLKYSWDFNSQDGIQEDAAGKEVTYRFRRSGEYTVTLTVTDPNGLLKPATDTTKIEVTE